ncbi:MAG: polysaccharide deacetylase family protein [Fibrobacterales bacterium]|nr:polysaccharide deacetylase family protein [Fibrobacterales bacterium]
MRYAALLPLLASAALLLASCGDSSSSSDDHLSSSGDASSSGSGDGANPSVAIAPWPGTAVAAYTLIADDFCGGLAGQAHADTMMANRGMGMAFGAMVASCSDGDWALARERIGRGHEIINHSWSHMCATTVERCGSGPTYGPELFEQEFGQSTQGIEQNAGVRPTFFIFPYDESTDTARAYLKGLGYLGARAGEKLKLNGDVFDPFRPNFDVNWPEGQKEGMQQWGFVTGLTDALIAQGHGWGIREIHGVNDGWGPIALDSMRAHADELKRLVDAGKLWVAPPSEVIRYHDQREHYGAEIALAVDTTVYPDLDSLVEIDTVYRIGLTGEPLDARYDGRPLTLVVTGLRLKGEAAVAEQGGRSVTIRKEIRVSDTLVAAPAPEESATSAPVLQSPGWEPSDTLRVEFTPGDGPMTIRGTFLYYAN